MVMRRGDYLDALKLHQIRFEVVKAAEEIASEHFDKTGPLNMAGLCYLMAGDDTQAPRYFAASYIEALISFGQDRAKLYSAYRTLTEGYRISDEDLNELVLTLKSTPDLTPDPFVVLENHEKRMNANLSTLVKSRLKFAINKQRIEAINPIESDVLKRVFVGGSFDNIIWLQRIENAILELGYCAIVAINFEQPKELSTDDFTKKLLALSGHAIFEMSVVGAAGHYVEMAQAKDMNLHCIGIYQSLLLSEHKFSGEVEWLSKKPYRSIEGLKALLVPFLAEVTPRP